MNKSRVLDASAILALLGNEAGFEIVAAAINQGAVVCAVNFSEVVSKLNEAGIPEKEIVAIIQSLGIETIEFDEELAVKAGMLRGTTRKAGLSFGDRACLALAEKLSIPAVTADRAWSELGLNIKVQLIR